MISNCLIFADGRDNSLLVPLDGKIHQCQAFPRHPDIFEVRKFISPSFEMIIPILLSFYALACCTYKGNTYVKVLSLIFIAEYLIRMYYFTPFVYYFIFLHAVSSILAGIAVADIINRWRYSIWIIIGYFIAIKIFHF